MKAVGYTQFEPGQSADVLVDLTLPDPVPEPRDLLVKVEAVAVNPRDSKARRVDPASPDAPRILGWDIHQDDPFFLSFLVATHLATALVLVGFFWEDWKRIVGGLLRSLRQREIRADDTDARLGWLLVAGTIPVGLMSLWTS